MRYKSEEEFGLKIVEILNKLGFSTWQEVYMSTKHYLNTPCCDIIALKDGIYYAFELKLNLNDKVLEQAKSHLQYVDYSYVIVPFRKKKDVSIVKKFYANTFGIGIIFADPLIFLKKVDNLVENKLIKNIDYFKITNEKSLKVYISAKKTEKVKKIESEKGIKKFLFKEQKESNAGTSSGNDKSTPFKRSCSKIYEYLQQHPDATKREVWNSLSEELHWKTYASMYSSFRAYGKSLKVMKKIVWKK